MDEQNLGSLLDTVTFLSKIWTLSGLGALPWDGPPQALWSPRLAPAWHEAPGTVPCRLTPAALSVGSPSSPTSFRAWFAFCPTPSRSRKLTKASLTHLEG